MEHGADHLAAKLRLQDGDGNEHRPATIGVEGRSLVTAPAPFAPWSACRVPAVELAVLPTSSATSSAAPSTARRADPPLGGPAAQRHDPPAVGARRAGHDKPVMSARRG